MFSKKAAIFSLSAVTQTNIGSKWTFVKYLKIALLFTSIHRFDYIKVVALIPLKWRQNSHFKDWHYILCIQSTNVIGADTIGEERRYFLPTNTSWWEIPFFKYWNSPRSQNSIQTLLIEKKNPVCFMAAVGYLPCPQFYLHFFIMKLF